MFTCATYLPQTKVLDNATIISLTIAGQKNDMQPKYQLRKKQISVREWKVTRRAAHWCAGQSVMGEKHTTELAQNPPSWHSQKHKFKDASEDRRAQLARTESGTSSHCVPDALLSLTPAKVSPSGLVQAMGTSRPWMGWGRWIPGLLCWALSCLVTQAFPSMKVPLSLPLQLQGRGPHRWTHAAAPRTPFPQGVCLYPLLGNMLLELPER